MRVCFVIAALAATSIALAQTRRPNLPPKFDGIGIEQHLNAQVPVDSVFHDESGALVPLRTYFQEKPVLLVPVYYTCPMLCSQILSGVVAGLRPLWLKPGRDFELVAISFNPAETPQDAAKERAYYSRSYSSKAGTAGWHFLTGSQSSIDAVMQAIGFHYRYDSATKMFIHASGVMAVTPEGRVARYFYGVEYEPKDLKLGLVEASHNRIGSPVDQILLFCFHYDPSTGKYGAVVMNMLRVAAVLVLAVIAVGMFFLWRRDIRQHQDALRKASPL